MSTTQNIAAPSEEKGTQSIDVLKSAVLIPTVVEQIANNFPGRKVLDLLDIGTGDRSSLSFLLKGLSAKGINLGDVGIIEKDRRMFQQIMGYLVLGGVRSDANVFFAEPGVMQCLDQTSMHEAFDAINIQLVLHLINNPAELSLMLFGCFRMLKPDGHLLLSDLDTGYIDYLSGNMPDKFCEQGEDRWGHRIGKYMHSNAEPTDMVVRNPEEVLAVALGNGFKLSAVKKPSLEPVLGIKPRYNALHQAGVPLFRVMDLKKSPESFISSTEGVVMDVVPEGEWMRINMMDGQFIRMPLIKDYERLHNGDRIVLGEFDIAKVGRCVNFWAIPDNNEEEMWSTQVMVKAGR